MSNYSTAEVWIIVSILALGTYLIRLSFLGFMDPDRLPPYLLKLLRYTPVAVLPAMVAPLAVWPPATGGQTDLPRLIAVAVAGLIGWRTRNTLWAAVAGFATLTGLLYLLG